MADGGYKHDSGEAPIPGVLPTEGISQPENGSVPSD
jgi:hypothetical protein